MPAVAGGEREGKCREGGGTAHRGRGEWGAGRELERSTSCHTGSRRDLACSSSSAWRVAVDILHQTSSYKMLPICASSPPVLWLLLQSFFTWARQWFALKRWRGLKKNYKLLRKNKVALPARVLNCNNRSSCGFISRTNYNSPSVVFFYGSM